MTKILLLALAANYWFNPGIIGGAVMRVLLLLLLLRMLFSLPGLIYNLFVQERHV